MKIEFDHAKNAKNIAERGLSFDYVAEFEWNTAEIVEDTRQNYGETRWIATGFLADRLYKLVYKAIPGGIRIISFRKANQREVKKYVSNH